MIALAVVYSEEGKLSEAERTVNEAATLLCKQPKRNAPKLAVVFDNLASLYRREGNRRKARKMSEKADGFRNPENSASWDPLGSDGM